MKGLLIRERWIALILAGRKIWEMRSKPTSVRGRIALIRSGSGLVVGTARLVGCEAPLTRQDYMMHQERHAIPGTMLDEVLDRGWVYPWVFEDVQPLAKPVPYSHPSGAVTFVNLDPSVVAEIERSAPRQIHSEGRDQRPSAGSKSEHGLFEEEAEMGRVTMLDGTTSPAPDMPWFVFRPETAQAHGKPLPDGQFLVQAGSTAMRHGSPNVKRDRFDSDALVRVGILLPEPDGRHYRFSCDHKFSSASKAAGVIKDGNASGPSLWTEVPSGRTLRAFIKATDGKR